MNYLFIINPASQQTKQQFPIFQYNLNIPTNTFCHQLHYFNPFFQTYFYIDLQWHLVEHRKYKYLGFSIYMGQCSPDNNTNSNDLHFDNLSDDKTGPSKRYRQNEYSVNHDGMEKYDDGSSCDLQQINDNKQSTRKIFSFFNSQPDLVKVKNHYKLSKNAIQTLNKLKQTRNSIKILDFKSQIYNFKLSKATYQGNFIRQNKPHGLGLAHFKSGEMYYGQFQFGVASGIGLYIFANGSYYYGKFIYSSFYGYGCLYYMTQLKQLPSLSQNLYVSQQLQQQSFPYQQLQSKFNSKPEHEHEQQNLQNQQQKTKSQSNNQNQFQFLLKNQFNIKNKANIEQKSTKLKLTSSPLQTNKHQDQIQQTKKQNFILMRYVGYFKRGLPHGHGEQVYADQCYIGNFEKGLKQGKGIHKWANGLLYQGNFNEGVFSGNGRITNSNKQDRVVYEGDFKNGMKNGIGYCYNQREEWSYHGQFRNDCLQGKGTKITKQSKIYDGMFIQNRLDGEGFIYHSDGTIWKAKWFKGALRQQTKIQRSQQIDNRIKQIKINHRINNTVDTGKQINQQSNTKSNKGL